VIAGIDHVALAVRDLDATRARLEALLGRTPEWVGADGGARHAWFQLENMALDVIAATGHGLTGDQITEHLDAHGEGIWAVAYGVADLPRTRRTFANRGLQPSEIGRIRATREAGAEKRYWTMATLPAEATAGVRTFLIDAAANFAWPPAAAGADAVTGLDHIVIRSTAPERAAALYGARLGLDMRLDQTAPNWGARLMFFRCGDLVVEVAHGLSNGQSDAPDQAWGLSWRVADADAARARIAAAGFDASEVRIGRKPGTRVFTVRDAPAALPTLFVQPAQRGEAVAP